MRLNLEYVAEACCLAARNITVVRAPCALFLDVLHSLLKGEGLVTFAALELQCIKSVHHEAVHLLGRCIALSAVGTVSGLFEPT